MNNEISCRPFRVIVAASGTGGHLFPAVHIATEVRRLKKEAQILFIGAGRPLEEKIIDSSGYARAVVSIDGLRRKGFFGFLAWLVKLPKAVLQVYKIMWTFSPDVVVGVGGYVSVLPVMIAYLCGIPSLIHEAEREAGWANRLLARIANKVTMAWSEAKIPATAEKKIISGQPLRAQFFTTDFSKTASQAAPQVLILGGSQGARTLDEIGMNLAPWFAENNIAVWHQCRPDHVQHVSARYEELRVNYRVVPFIDKMEEALAWSDVVVTRSGAGAVRELIVCGRPAVLVPLPNSPEQFDNAQVLVKRHQGISVKEYTVNLSDEASVNDQTSISDEIKKHLREIILNGKTSYSSWAKLPEQSEQSNAAQIIATEIVKFKHY